MAPYPGMLLRLPYCHSMAVRQRAKEHLDLIQRTAFQTAPLSLTTSYLGGVARKGVVLDGSGSVD